MKRMSARGSKARKKARTIMKSLEWDSKLFVLASQSHQNSKRPIKKAELRMQMRTVKWLL